MKYFLFFRTIPKAVNLTLFVSFSTLCIKIVWLNAIPAPFEWMVSFGMIMEAILASVIASYVFYLFVVHYPEHQKRKVVIPVIAPLCQRIGNYSYHITNHIYREADLPLLSELQVWCPTKVNIKQLEMSLKVIRMKCYDGSTSSQENKRLFFSYITGDTEKVNNDIEEVLGFINNLVMDTELTKSLLTLRSSRFRGTMMSIVEHGKYMGLDEGVAELFDAYNNECIKIYEIGKKLESLYGVSTRI
ncbi:hypothetical protein [Vibrio splendidus]|uniref:hypothetical protein n=1 Tax=Vibrio splendidus TaxID=29497 RepID=UPI000C83BFB0|nr:hypothetical protein [Vibrio splendidus]PMJ59376.1 hypothetical protein BCU23_03015 [Vibrio splendidus]